MTLTGVQGHNNCQRTNSLVFYLVIEMAREPVQKRAGSDVGSGVELHGDPVFITSITPDVVGQVTHLSAPHKPVTLQHPAQQSVKLLINQLCKVNNQSKIIAITEK